MKFTIRRKMLLSYLAMAVVTALASAYAIGSLQNLNRTVHDILHEDIAVLEVAGTMLDVLLAQENAEKKNLILRDRSLEEIFQSRGNEFRAKLSLLQKTPLASIRRDVERLSDLHRRYEETFRQEIALIQSDRLADAVALSQSESRGLIENIAQQLKIVQRRAEESRDLRMGRIDEGGKRASRAAVALAAASLLVGLLMAFFITQNIAGPLRKLEKATALVAEGKFDASPDIRREDEIGSLSLAFGSMTKRLKVLETINLDASPLTRLPGNLAIEKEIGERRAAGRLFALCHIDLDNFKPFADKYGYAWGSEVIKEVAQILSSSLDPVAGDFVGHIGGDDFVLIAAPDRAEAIGRRLVADFDARVLRFFSEEDRKQGFCIAKDRKGVVQPFPLVTITVAMVTDDGSRFESPHEMARKAAELKEFAKTLPGSNFVKQTEGEPRPQG
ncbi:MAG: Methyl-accepting chemotaxis protein CtpH [Syntrophaceae bacterium PtaU1.Bin231]|nr:MAG: Methyl-accepting chemotaxis protein CtpH [Syntrophaceae bacterium PtaU1.Bin231]